MKKAIVMTTTVVFSLIFGLWVLDRVVSAIQFDRQCEGYLKRAADSNSVELAKENLAKALRYIEANELTTGFTSIFYTTPDEDVGFWYQNIKTSHEELERLNPNSSSLEKTNVLMKLRETLLDEGKEGVGVTVPKGISVYPSNTFFMLWGSVSFVLACVFVCYMSRISYYW